MPADLTGYSISDVYSSFLHLSTNFLTNTPRQVVDGVGNLTPLLLSTRGVTLSGDIYLSETKFPIETGTQYQILRLDANGGVEFSSIIDTLVAETGTVFPDDGIYGAPVITIDQGLLTKVEGNPAINTFYIREDDPVTDDYINVVTEDWKYPVVGDIAFVLNLSTNAAYKLKYTGASLTGWQILKSI